LEVEVSISPEASRASIPAMIIQHLIENAIKHGISQAGASGELSVHITTFEDMVA
jgi:LytS/YehU family sensor histidine kinase